MSARVDQFCDALRDRLNSMETRVEAFKSRVRAIPEKAEAELRKAQDEAHLRVEAGKKRVEQLRTKLRAGADQKLAETKQTIRDWKAKGESKRLIARADFAEAYAADAVEFAVMALDEAEGAVLDAALARMDAHGCRGCTRVISQVQGRAGQ